jgi:hypothetical protein
MENDFVYVYPTILEAKVEFWISFIGEFISTIFVGWKKGCLKVDLWGEGSVLVFSTMFQRKGDLMICFVGTEKEENISSIFLSWKEGCIKLNKLRNGNYMIFEGESQNFNLKSFEV